MHHDKQHHLKVINGLKTIFHHFTESIPGPQRPAFPGSAIQGELKLDLFQVQAKMH